MHASNLTFGMGTVVSQGFDATIKNISFTPIEWAQFADAVNKSNATALNAGLLIGAASASIGIFTALLYLRWKEEKDWKEYGKS